MTRVRNGEDAVTVIMIGKATRTATDTAIETIEEVGIARTERRDDRDYDDEDRPRRRVKICIEYENGDEYCRYKGR